MKSEIRQKLAQLPFEEKIRKVGDIKSHPQGERFGAELYGGRLRAFASRSREAGDSVLVNREIRGVTKLVKITEDVRKYAAEQGIAENEALEKGLKEKATQFQQAGVEIYLKP